jgi:SpoIIAA-like
MLTYKEYDNALAIEIVIKGVVSTKEFEDAATKLEAFIARHSKVNVLEVIEDFEGMDAAAFWEDFKFTLRHLNDFSRCAIVSDGNWVTPWSEIVAPFFKGEVRYFPPAEIEAAREWLLFPGDNDKT